MDLTKIKPSIGIEVVSDDGWGISTERFNNEIIFIHNCCGETRRVLWKDQSLLQLLEDEFINIENIKKVIDWSKESNNIIYKRFEIILTKEEIKKRLGMKYLIIED